MGFGKFVIVKYIVLKYKESGWVVKKIINMNIEINDLYIKKENEILFIINDLFGKMFFNEDFYCLWNNYKKWL